MNKNATITTQYKTFTCKRNRKWAFIGETLGNKPAGLVRAVNDDCGSLLEGIMDSDGRNGLELTYFDGNYIDIAYWKNASKEGKYYFLFNQNNQWTSRVKNENSAPPKAFEVTDFFDDGL